MIIFATHGLGKFARFPQSFFLSFIFCLWLLSPQKIAAHPSPNTLILLDIKEGGVAVELQIPIRELLLAFGKNEVQNPKQSILQLGDSLKTYILAHITPLSLDGQKWAVNLTNLHVQDVATPTERGDFQDVVVHLWMQPPNGGSTHDFTINYDVVLHEVVTHNAIVSIKQYGLWGLINEPPLEYGFVTVNPRYNQISPIVVQYMPLSFWAYLQKKINPIAVMSVVLFFITLWFSIQYFRKNKDL
jgi:hypothetical protein